MTNKTPVGTYRGPGRFEANFFMERMIDMIAADLGIDRIEIPPQEPDHHRRSSPIRSRIVQPTDAKDEYDSGEYRATLDRALKEIDWPKMSKLGGKLIDGKYHGLGVVCFIEGGAAGPKETARLEVDDDGTISVYHGHIIGRAGRRDDLRADRRRRAGGADRAYSRTCYHGSTAYVSDGYGAYHSRSTVMGGSAVLDAANNFMTAICARPAPSGSAASRPP